MDRAAYHIAQQFVRAQIRRRVQADQGEFWQWMRQTHPRVRNPNPDGQKDIAADTLKEYASGNGPFASSAQQIVQQYYRQFQQNKDEGSGAQQQTPKDKELARNEINQQNLDIAKYGEVVSKEVLSSGGVGSGGPVNASYIVELEHGGKKQNFIYKPAEGEEAFLRVNIPGGQYHAREQAAFSLDNLIGGQGIVPVTHTRGKDEGSFQLWAEGSKSMGGKDLDRLVDQVPLDQLSKSPDFERLNVLDLLMGHEDRHRGNLLHYFDGDENPENLRFVAIDNGLSMASPSKYPEHRVYKNPWAGYYKQDLTQSEEDQKLDLRKGKAAGDKAVAKSLTNISPELHEQIKKVDLKDVAKSLTEAGIDDEGAVRAMLVRLAAVQEDPKIFDKMMDQFGTLDNAWKGFQHLSGDVGHTEKGDDLLRKAGAESRSKDIDAALSASRPSGGWVALKGLENQFEEMEKMRQKLKDEAAAFADTAAPDQKTRPEGGKFMPGTEPLGPKTASLPGTKPLGPKTAPLPRTAPLGPKSVQQPGTVRLSMVQSVSNQWLLKMARSSKKKLEVKRVNPGDRSLELLATFEVRKGKVHATYKDPRFKNEIRQGVRLYGKKYTMDDGPVFMVALEKTYGPRSLYDVKRV